MKLNRAKFIQHLQRIACAGQCAEAVFHDGFAATAFVPDQLLLIDAPELEGAEPLPAEVGMANLDRLMKALRLSTGEGNSGIEVDVYVEDNRLVIDDTPHGGPKQQLMLAAPKTIATRVETETVDKLLALDEEGLPSIPLTQSVLAEVVAAFALYKAAEIEVQVGPKGGKLVVGTEATDLAEFSMPAAKSPTEYTLLFDKHLIDVFSTITDFSNAAFRIRGDKQPMFVQDGDFLYMLVPKQRSADEISKPKRKAAAAEAALAEAEAPAKPKGRRRGGKK